MQLTVKEAASLLNVPEKTIHRWIKRRAIPVYEINEQFRFNRAELLEWATSQRIQISPELFRKDEPDKASLASLSDALQAGGVAYRVGGHDKSSVLRAVVKVLNLPEEVDREFLYEVLLARESLGSTGIGDGIAIPHVRNPVVLHVATPSVTLCFLQHPVDFLAVDNQPVSALFTLISPTVQQHLHLLSRLGFVLQNRDFKAALKQQAPADELMAALSRAEAEIPAASKSQGNGQIK